MLSVPHAWAETAVARHIHAPYSGEVMAESFKDWIDLGHVDFKDIPTRENHTSFGGDYFGTHGIIKHSDEEYDPEAQPAHFRSLHDRFMNAAIILLGEGTFIKSSVNFTHTHDEIIEGHPWSYSLPHMDGNIPGRYPPDIYDEERGKELKLLGTAMDGIPTITLQGATRLDDFTGEKGVELKKEIQDSGRLSQLLVPINRQLLLPPSLVHFAQTPTYSGGRRHWMRWQLKI